MKQDGRTMEKLGAQREKAKKNPSSSKWLKGVGFHLAVSDPQEPRALFPCQRHKEDGGDREHLARCFLHLIGVSFGVLLTHLSTSVSLGRGPCADLAVSKYLGTFTAKVEVEVTMWELLRFVVLSSNMEASLRISYLYVSLHSPLFLFFPSFISLSGNNFSCES